MKKYLLLIVLLLFFTGIQAQTRADTLRQSKDYLNDKLTYLLLQEFVKDKPAYQDTLQTLNNRLQNISANNPLPYVTLSTILKGKFDKVLIKFSDPVDKIDINSFISQPDDKAAAGLVDTVFYVLSKKYPEYTSALQSNKGVLKDSVLFLLSKANAQPLQPQHTVADTSTGSDVTQIVQPVNLTPVWILFALFAAAIITLTLLMNRRLKAAEKKLKNITADAQLQTADKIPDSAYTNAINAESQKRDIARLIDNNDAIKGFQKAIATLQDEVYKLQTEQKNPLMKSTVVTQQSLQQEKKSAGETFYMSSPVNNYFPLSVKSLTKEDTVYKFIIKSNKQEAAYELHTSGAPINEILRLRESYIKPACDEENLPGANVKNIITVNAGIAMLEGDKWIIKTKALIRYE